MTPARLRVCISAPLAVFLAGCGSSSSTNTQLSVPAPLSPGVVSATANPQVASYAITPSKPSALSVEFGLASTYGMATSAQHTAAGGGPVSVLVAGMKASTLYHMRAKVANDDGTSQVDVDQTFTTGATPPGLVANYTVAATNGLTPQPGVELVNILPGAVPSIPFVTDTSGNVLWTYTFPDRQPGSILYPIKLLDNGNFGFLIGPPSGIPLQGPTAPGTLDVYREIDLAGNSVRQLTMDDLNASLVAKGFGLSLQVFTHDFAVLPNGHVLLMANTTRSFTGLNGNAGTTNVLGDVIVDVDKNFNPVWVWNEFDHLDVNRQPMGFPDWTHSNAVVYSPDDGNFLVSIRHQNWIVKVDYRDGAGTGNVLWKLGQGGDFTLKGGVDPTDWFYAQHDPNFVSANTSGLFTLAIMDNGNNRSFPSGVVCDSPGAPGCFYTTAPVMQIDEIAKTASFVSHTQGMTYSPFAGSARVLSNGNVEYDLGGAGTESYTYEVTPTSSPQTVWQMHVVGSNTYRSFRIGSLYPGVQW